MKNKQILSEIKIEIERYFKDEVKKIKRVRGGLSNLCIYVKLSRGKELFIKKYSVDERKRLEREYGSLTLLNNEKRGHIRVAKPYFFNKDKYFGVYSFINGRVKKPSEIGEKEIIDLVNYAVELHSIKLSEKNMKIFPMRAVLSVNSLEDHVRNLDFKMERFYKYYNQLPKSNVLKRKIESKGYLSKFDNLQKKILATIPENKLKEKITEDKLRFNHIDFGFHNTIYYKKNSFLLDYELSGWGDPYRMIGDLMVHDANIKVPLKLRKMFLEKYLQKRKLNQSERLRCDQTIKLMDLEWIGTYLWAITPEKIKMRKLALTNFSEEDHIKKLLSKTEKRLLHLSSK